MFDQAYGYFVGGIILGWVWLFCWWRRKDLRKEIMFGSLLGLPFGFSEFLFVPEYWEPPSLFNLVNLVGFGIESFMFAFFAAGIATIVYEASFHRNLRKKPQGAKHPLVIKFSPYLIMVTLFLVGELVLPFYSIYNLISAGLVAAVMVALLRQDLLPQILASGLLFMILYFCLYLFYNLLFPNYIQSIYSLQNFSGVSFYGFPIEEALFGLSLGAAWSAMYEFVFNYQTVKKRRGH